MLDRNGRDEKLRTPAGIGQTDQHVPHPSFQGGQRRKSRCLAERKEQKVYRGRKGVLLQLFVIIDLYFGKN
jgi:hypothetical protein